MVHFFRDFLIGELKGLELHLCSSFFFYHERVYECEMIGSSAQSSELWMYCLGFACFKTCFWDFYNFVFLFLGNQWFAHCSRSAQIWSYSADIQTSFKKFSHCFWKTCTWWLWEFGDASQPCEIFYDFLFIIAEVLHCLCFIFPLDSVSGWGLAATTGPRRLASVRNFYGRWDSCTLVRIFWFSFLIVSLDFLPLKFIYNKQCRKV